MRTSRIFAGWTMAVAALLSMGDLMAMADEPVVGFSNDVAFLKRHTNVVVLEKGRGKVAVVPEFQGRVMTSTTGGEGEPSFGWINYKLIEGGVLSAEKAEGRLEEHIYVFGGEERFWLGPEGGQFSIFFAPGTKFVFDDWHTPASLDTEPFDVVSQDKQSACFRRSFQLTNYSGTKFDVQVDRTIDVHDAADVAGLLGVAAADDVAVVGYTSRNVLKNRGEAAWTKETGLLSIWMLGMYKPSATTTVVIPFKAGDESKLGPRVNDTYFGKVPADKLRVADDVLFFSGDGTHRSKIGISPQRSRSIAGSYDAAGQVLTIVTYNQPKEHVGYVNSMWELQEDPFSGDVLNSYNDGPPAPGEAPLGPFYELETSSPAAALKSGESITHEQTTVHFQGDVDALDRIAQKLLGVTIAEITSALDK